MGIIVEKKGQTFENTPTLPCKVKEGIVSQ